MGGTGIAYCIFLCMIDVFAADYTITPINSSSGLYYEKIGEVSLSNNNWEFITYVNYADYLIFYQYLHQQAETLRQFCDEFKSKMNGSNECDEKLLQVEANMKLAKENNDIMSSYLGIPVKRRTKRSWQVLAEEAAPYLLESLGKVLAKHILSKRDIKQKLSPYLMSRRKKRSWVAVAQIVAPYFLEPLGQEFARSLFGKNDINMETYNQQIAELQNSQNDMMNEIKFQKTIFKVDSQTKGEQIDYLKKTQDKIKEQLKMVTETAIKDSEEKGRKINDLENLLNITQNQIKTQEQSIRSNTNNIAAINTTLKRVDSNLKELTLQISSSHERINKLNFLSILNSMISDFLFLWSRFQHEQNKLSDVVINANRGYLDPFIVTPIKLIDMLIEAQGHLPEATKYPLQPSLENAMKLYNLIEPNIYFYNYTLVFRLNLKLVNFKNYHLYKMNSAPTFVGEDKFAFILPQKPYLVIDRTEQEYAMVSENEFEKCRSIGVENFVCDGITEVNINSDLDCEVNLFLKAEILPYLCDIRIIHLRRAIFFQLSAPQSWMYAVPNTKDIAIKCGHSRDMQRLEKSGFLSASSNCAVLIDGNSLKHVHFDSKPSQTYLPPVKLLDYIDKSKINFLTEQDHQEPHLQLNFPYDFEVQREKLRLNSVSVKDILKLRNKAQENSEKLMLGNDYIAIIAVATITIFAIGLLVCVNKIFHCNFPRRNDN